MRVYLVVAAVTDRALFLFPSHLCDLHFHHLYAPLEFASFNSLSLTSCNHYVRRCDLKLETVCVIINLFSIE
jgi:hypothetical protein